MPKFPVTPIHVALVLLLAPGLASIAAEPSTRFELGGRSIDVSGDLNGFDLSVRTAGLGDGLDIAVLTLSRATADAPPQLTLSWSQPSHDISGLWTPDISLSKTVPPDWREIDKILHSMLTRQAPVLTLFGSDDSNRTTVAVSDAVNPVVLDARVREEDARIYYSIALFTERHERIDNFSISIRLDQRKIPFYTALRDVSDWWAAMPGYAPAYVPDIARQAVYSTWYSYHQNIDHDSMLREVRAARKMGFRAIIVDDGWQTLDSSRGYAFAGDWKPERLPRMREFVDAVHAEGMAAMLWYSVPFVGEHSEAYERFRGKYLVHFEHYGSYVLDPRYPEVRAFLIEHYRHAISEWGWDGLKLDFIDQFRTQDNTVLDASDGRDYASVYDAVDRLMTDVITELRKLKPDIAIEFRQNYIGPKMRTYGNMFRAHDSPNLAFVNRGKVVDLRLLSGNTAVHSDMIMWHYDEPVHIAAFQLLNVLFSVPQVSVRLEDIPRDHFDMIRFYTGYWQDNRDVLLDGEFMTVAPLLNYPVISGSTADKKIMALYADMVIRLDDDDSTRKRIDIVNAKSSERIVIDIPSDLGSLDILIRDCTGKTTDRRTTELRRGLVSFDVPVSGLLSMSRH